MCPGGLESNEGGNAPISVTQFKGAGVILFLYHKLGVRRAAGGEVVPIFFMKV